jgi:K+-sensing histidine kinase KdpD
MKALLIEDNRIFQIKLRNILNSLGYEVTTVSSVKESVMHLKIEKFDLLICDIVLSDGEFFDIDTVPVVPTIFITAHENPIYMEKALKVNNAIFIVKPFSDLTFIAAYKSRKEVCLQTAEIQRLSAVRDQYIYIVAHDLKSPILAMQGMYDLIKESIKKQRYDDLERISYYIDETGIKTMDLLDNLLMWGMSQSEEFAYEPVQLNVREEVNKALSAYEAIEILNNFSFSNDCPETTTVFVDQDSLQLILRNLIDNAAKHLPSSRGQIDIDVVESTTENMSCITVSDNGSGIDSSQLEPINYAFNNPSKVMIGEKGLGLGIVNIARFTEKNRGSITVESSLETGTKFEICLPTEM